MEGVSLRNALLHKCVPARYYTQAASVNSALHAEGVKYGSQGQSAKRDAPGSTFI